MKLKFCGAARHVTGSAHLLTLDDGFTILLDCGLYQGRSKDMKTFNENWYFDPKSLNCLILSHAHIDHSGRIPKLVKDGFNGSIFCTHATRSLSTIMLLDSAKIQVRDADYYNRRMEKKGKKKRRYPLYNTEDVRSALDQFVSFSYDQWFKVHPNVEVLFKDAGHILGSASVSLRIKTENDYLHVGFTGDVGRPNRPILRDPQLMPEMEFVICESTYGDKEHTSQPSELEKFLKIINHTCVKKKGKLIIPAFSVGRTQEIIYILDQLETAGRLPHIPVFVDSPLAVNATQVFSTHPECFDAELHEYLLTDDNPFGFNELTYVHEVEVSKQLNHMEQPSIIISSSGMMNAGRIRHHLFNNIDNAKNTFLIVGYCAPGTPGGMLRDGVSALKIFGEYKVVKADIEIMDSFSAHADRSELYDFIEHQKPGLKKLFLVHGELDRQEKFKDYLEKKGFPRVEIPVLGSEYELS